MVQCFAPDCRHTSESHTCRFFGFPSQKKKKEDYTRWIKLLRRADKLPGNHSRVCSCHFRDGLKENGPEIFQRNKRTMFPPDDYSEKRKEAAAKRKRSSGASNNPVESVEEMVQQYREQERKAEENEMSAINRKPVAQIVLEAELQSKSKELEVYKEKAAYHRSHYSASTLSEEVIRMETGLPTREVFNIVVLYALRFKDSIRYYYGWVVNLI
ncbi:hypothetical protein AC249_AIPGENE21903 [Exaiptasia diaphana]|nr:hypothetical protein AC249_AIPGENE21903 [Exaiptasia diaphana]